MRGPTSPSDAPGAPRALALGLVASALVAAGALGAPHAARTAANAPRRGPAAVATPVVGAADADAFVRRVDAAGDPANYGGPNVTTIVVGSRSMGDFYLTWRGLLRFALPSLPAGAVVESATLELRHLSSDAPSGAPVGIEVCAATAAWDELAVSWLNQPGAGAPCAAADVPVAAGAWRAWDVTAAVAAWYAGAPNRGFVLRRVGDGAPAQQRRDFAGRTYADAALRPRLVVGYRVEALTGWIRADRGCLETGGSPVYRPGDGLDALLRVDGAPGEAVAVDLHGGPAGTTELLAATEVARGVEHALSALRRAQGRGPLAFAPDAVGRRTLSLKRAADGVPLGICSFDVVPPTATPRSPTPPTTPPPVGTPVPLAAPSEVACAPFLDPAGRFHRVTWRGEDPAASQLVVERAEGAAPGGAAALADLDGDGRADLALSGRAAPALVRVARSLGASFAAPAAAWAVAAPAAGEAVAFGDVDGDGRADLVALDATEGLRALVARSDGARFAPAATTWLEAAGVPGGVPFLADVDGDHRADLVLAPRPADGPVRVARAVEGRFEPPAVWLASFAARGETLALGDADGDGRADLVRFTCGAAGDVFVARSDGSRFVPDAAPWHDRFCYGDERPAVGDLDGDGRADLVTVNLASGDVFGARSDGARFVGYAERWAAALVRPDDGIHLADVDGDGRADLVLLPGAEAAASDLRVARSTGTSFGAPTTWYDDLAALWWTEVGRAARGAGTLVDGPLDLPPGAARSYRVRALAASPPPGRSSPWAGPAVCAVPTPAGATVVGRVRLERRASDAGAMVRLDDAETTTGADGAFAFAGVAPGRHVLRAAHPSYLDGSVAIDVEASPLRHDAGLLALLAGDVDRDGAVTAADEALVLAAIGARPGAASWAPALDITDDGLVDLLDLVAVRFNLGRTRTGPP